MIFRRLKYLFFPDEDSLKSKFLFDFTKHYLLICTLLVSLVTFYQIKYLNLNFSIIDFLYKISFIFLTLLLIRFILSKILNKHFLKRISEYESDAKSMINRNRFNKLSITGSDEIDKLAFYTNNILEKYENLLELEKKNSLVDPLTLCYNRRALDLNFIGLKDKAIRMNNSISLVLFDIDNFKKVNDIYGHNIGDKVLVELAKTIRGVVRKYDSVYRIGGEEFLILLPNLKKREINEFIVRLMREITYQLKKTVPEVLSPITVSGGFVCSNDFDLNDDKVLADMIVHADTLLYDAKSNGKNKILVK